MLNVLGDVLNRMDWHTHTHGQVGKPCHHWDYSYLAELLQVCVFSKTQPYCNWLIFSMHILVKFLQESGFVSGIHPFSYLHELLPVCVFQSQLCCNQQFSLYRTANLSLCMLWCKMLSQLMEISFCKCTSSFLAFNVIQGLPLWMSCFHVFEHTGLMSIRFVADFTQQRSLGWGTWLSCSWRWWLGWL